MNFDANEIKRQAGRINEQLIVFNNRVNAIINDLEEMAGIVVSEDSNLSEELRQYSQTYMQIQNVIAKEFAAAATTINDYATKTLSNQEELQKNVNVQNTELQEIQGVLSGVASSLGTAQTVQGAVGGEFVERASEVIRQQGSAQTVQGAVGGEFVERASEIIRQQGETSVPEIYIDFE